MKDTGVTQLQSEIATVLENYGIRDSDAGRIMAEIAEAEIARNRADVELLRNTVATLLEHNDIADSYIGRIIALIVEAEADRDNIAIS